MDMTRKTPWQKEWNNLLKAEARYQKRRTDGPTSLLLTKLDRFIPEKLSGTLAAAFFKAFQVIFEKGTRLIEMTYNSQRRKADFKVSHYANELYGDYRSARQFTKNARGSRLFNLLISFLEGTLLGLVGLGIPDIPLFIAMVLKGVYEVALSYGYDYHDENEKVFILKVIAVAMKDDEEFMEADAQLNADIDVIARDYGEIGGWNIDKNDQIRITSDSLVKEMIYTKFIQGWAIVGVFGGIFDPVYQNRITKYAMLKYRRRFLAARLEEERNAQQEQI
ncbi:MAG: EcsC family protein [Firmicutes bacterium]|nr:EcsC family protein [Bacillota bacterium]